MTLRVLALAGDGIGPEVMAQGLRVLNLVAGGAGIEVEVCEDLIHGQAWDAYGVFCRDETVAAALDSHGVLVGAVGGPRWDGLVPDGTPEEQDGLMRLRRELDVFAGLRPARALSCLADRTPYRPEVVVGTDLLVLREMCGGVMFAPPQGGGAPSRKPSWLRHGRLPRARDRPPCPGGIRTRQEAAAHGGVGRQSQRDAVGRAVAGGG